MGGKGSKESADKILQDFAPEERAHLLSLAAQMEQTKDDIDGEAFQEFCKILPESERVSLYRAIIQHYSGMAKDRHHHHHQQPPKVLTKEEFFASVKDVIKGSQEEKSNFCFDWCSRGAGSVDKAALRSFVAAIGSTAMGIHPLRMKNKYSYHVTESFVDFVLMKPFSARKPSYMDGSSSSSSLDLVDLPKKQMGKEDFYQWFCKNNLFQTMIDLVFTRMFLRSRDVYHMSRTLSNTEAASLEAHRKMKREKGLNPPILNDASHLLETEHVWLLNTYVPPECRHKWKLLYSDFDDGKSWSVFSASIVEQGATLLVMEDEKGHVFGAFALEGIKKMPNFYGSRANFLFSVKPRIGIYLPSGLNDNLQYFNTGTKTLPNGLGYGGQFNYFGLWINEDFEMGHSKAKPFSTTYNSPQLSAEEEFKIGRVEVWCLLEPVVDPNRDEPHKSVLDAFKEDRAILEMGGRTQHSQHLREAPEEGEE